NAALVVSDGMQARLGALGAGREWFKPWRTISGLGDAPAGMTELQVMLEGVFEQRRFLDLLRYFIVFEDEGAGKLTKKMAGYHQFHAVNVAVEETLRAAQSVAAGPIQETRGRYDAGPQPGGERGDRRVGVVWHTQGSGKSLTMAFYAGRVILHPAMANPTIVVLTDRNDLDDQLFRTFARCHELLRQPPVQAADRADLREKLSVGSGGVVFTTIQKFFPEEKGDRHPVLSERRNIVVIADEAHRSQYDFIDGFARHMRDALPHASFIGFTGTPIERTDANTRAVFGDYISVYDIQRAVIDGATVPIYYESRLAKLALNEAQRPTIDEDFEEATEGEEVERREKLKSKWAQLEAVVGSENRIKLVASDLVQHFEARLAVMDGKAMVVVMSRRIAVDLYQALVALRPEWAGDDDEQGTLKVVMTGSASDPLDWQPHIRNKQRRERLAERFRDPGDPFKIVIVRDMWLTGFDAPSLHTMYLDKPMRGHGLMQAIARVNRVFKDKPGGLVVDYLGLADELKQALATYTEAGGTGQTALDQNEAVALMLQKYEICRDLFYGFDWSIWITGASGERMSLLPQAQEHILAQEDGKKRLLQHVTELSQAFALAVPHEETLRIRDDVGFFQAVRAVLAKSAPGESRSNEEMELAIRQIISDAVVSDKVVDIFAAAGLKKPDISILSDEFLAEVRHMPQRNLAVELLQRLLKGEIRERGQRNVVQARSFAALLEQALRKYQNRAIETGIVIEELIKLAREMREAEARGEDLGLNEDELAFYDALEVNDSAVKILGDDTLKMIARELVSTVRRNVTIDWTLRENVRAHLRVVVKRILRKYGYPPDKQEQATQTVLEQAALFADQWAA
ncbi:MAG TPA: type I restriction endonuclease subunit R, partial [Nitrolancea sp.]|nr:type I restriction endonuclease subunit R [Nitrolancea sp.]